MKDSDKAVFICKNKVAENSGRFFQWTLGGRSEVPGAAAASH